MRWMSTLMNGTPGRRIVNAGSSSLDWTRMPYLFFMRMRHMERLKVRAAWSACAWFAPGSQMTLKPGSGPSLVLARGSMNTPVIPPLRMLFSANSGMRRKTVEMSASESVALWPSVLVKARAHSSRMTWSTVSSIGLWVI